MDSEWLDCGGGAVHVLGGGGSGGGGWGGGRRYVSMTVSGRRWGVCACVGGRRGSLPCECACVCVSVSVCVCVCVCGGVMWRYSLRSGSLEDTSSGAGRYVTVFERRYGL